MSKNNVFIIALPLVLLLLIMQVYHLWGWLGREGWVQYLMMTEVYVLFLISILFSRSIIRLQKKWVYVLTLSAVPLFFFSLKAQEQALGTFTASLWYINLLVSLIIAIWLVVVILGIFWAVREALKIKMVQKEFLIGGVLLALSALMTYLIKMSQLADGMLIKIWEIDKLRTIWFLLEPFLVLSFSIISLSLYIQKQGLKGLKKEYVLASLFVFSLGFEYVVNGFSLVSLRTVIYFLGMYSFINLRERSFKNSYLLAGIFMFLVGVHLNYFSSSDLFFTPIGFISYIHASLIESIKIFIALYIFIVGWSSVKVYASEFRFIMISVVLISYTYTTQSQGNGVEFYDIMAITAMLKLSAFYLVILYSFYYFRRVEKKELDLVALFSRS